MPLRLLRRSKFAAFMLRHSFLPRTMDQALALLFASRPLQFGEHVSVTGTEAPRECTQNRRLVALFVGCVGSQLFAHTNDATLKTLEQNGCQVINPKAQHCCGALHAHAGELELTRALARKNIDVFEKCGAEAVIVNIAGCGAMLKQYGDLLADDDNYRWRAKHFASTLQDISEFLARIDFQPGPRTINLKVTYSAPCHLYHGQGVTNAPIDLVAKIKNLEFAPLQNSDQCCGGAGVYNLVNPDLADEILAAKLEKIRQTGAKIVLTGNAGCLMHIASGAERSGLPISVIHPVELLALTYE